MPSLLKSTRQLEVEIARVQAIHRVVASLVTSRVVFAKSAF